MGAEASKAITAFLNDQPLAAWPYIVGVKDGQASLWVYGHLIGTTDGKKKYTTRTFAREQGFNSVHYNELWVELVQND